jgi:diguanylate cyclase (GGDEF)-like protein/PAS domain S-box-containing protein
VSASLFPGDADYGALLENASDIVALVSAGGTIRYINAAVERVMGWSSEERVGRSTFEWVHPEDAPRVLQGFTDLAQGSESVARLTCRVRHRDGSWRVLEATGTNLLHHPSLQGIVLTARDVTDRVRAEAARRQFAAVLDATPDLVFTSDAQGRLLYTNRAAAALLGIDPAAPPGVHLTDLYPGWAAERLTGEALPGVARDGSWRGDLAVRRPDGREMPVSQLLLAHHGETGEIEFLSGTARDITASKRAEAAVRESEERFRQLAENIQEVFWLVDRANWKVLFVSPAYERVWGRSCAELLADPASLIAAVHPADRPDGPSPVQRFLDAEGDREFRIFTPDGQLRWIRSRSFPVADAKGEVYRIAAISEDVTERRIRDELLQRMALHDSLTGLPNRAALLHRFQRALDRTEHAANTAFSVLFVDLDRFKLINDSLGHSRGDELLVEISRRLEACVRPEDMVARLGGDEFAVLLHSTARPADAARVAERILASFAEPFMVGEHEVFAGASIGIVPGGGYVLPEDLLRDADIAMYRAKLGGRGTYRVFDAAMHARVVARLQLETELRRALERGEFRLRYQPVVALESGRVVGVEALLRWEHPLRGELAPADFIEVAEEIGAIIPLGWWAMREACEQLVRWGDVPADGAPLAVSVNLSASHFSRRDLATRVRETLLETGLDPRRLRIEITESVIIESSRAARAFDELTALGVALHIDDFGTGYSSLSYLDRFPIDAVKIDRSLVSRIGPDGAGGEIVRTVITLAHDLGMTVVAEGVETEAQLRHLRLLGCDFAQGYLLARPLTPVDAATLLAEARRW